MINNMDHAEAIKSQAAEKYALGELNPAQMAEYEEHYFDCAECALDIKAVMAFADASCQVFRQKESKDKAKEAVPFFDRIFGWLRPAFAVPVVAGLLLFIGYQNTVTIPRAKQQSADSSASVQRVPLVASTQAYDTTLQLHGAARGARRGEQSDEAADRVSVHSGQSFEVKFDFLPGRSFERYIGQLQDEAGSGILEVPLSSGMANKEVRIPVAAGLVHSGKYQLVIAGDPAASGKFQAEKEATAFTFTVEIVP